MASSLSSTLLICSLFLFVTKSISSSKQCARYPKEITADQLYNRSDRFSDGEDSLPFIDSQKFLDTLAQTASICNVKSAMIVLGPKSSGKSEGLKRIIPMWEQSGHFVIVINLKGWENNASSPSVMEKVAKRVSNFFFSLNYQAQKCVFNRLLYSECVMIPWWLSIITSDKSWIYLFLISPLIVYILSHITCLFFRIQVFTDLLSELWKNLRLKELGITLAIILLFAYGVNWYLVLETVVHPIRENIASSNWYALTCSCNALSVCVPEHRPIVIVQEVTNLNTQSLNAFLRSLEQMKEGGLRYPVFVESSDFQWAFETPLLKSSTSFDLYLLNEMTQEEGFTEVVKEFKIWTEEEYKTIYDAVGGHRGSYMQLYRSIKVYNNSLDESIQKLKKRAYGHLHDTYQIVRNETAVREWLLSFKHSNYTKTTTTKIPEDVRMLLEMNILFRDEGYIYPQNRLMKDAIDKFIQNFQDSDPQ